MKILGCGSAFYAGLAGAHVIESLTRVPADAEPASEFRYRNPVVEPDVLYVAVSQSGETADTLAAVREIRRKGGRVLGIVNVVGSTIARECEGGIYMHAGPEVSVCSTKSFTCTARWRSRCWRCISGASATCRRRVASDSSRRSNGCPEQIAEVLAGADAVRAVAEKYASRDQRVLPRPRGRLSGGARGRAEAEGGLLHPCGGVPGIGAEARAARAGLARDADGHGSPAATTCTRSRCRPSRRSGRAAVR